MFDRAVEEFRDTRPEDDDGLGDASQMIGILARLGSSKRALAVGLGSGGAAGTFPAVRCNVNEDLAGNRLRFCSFAQSVRLSSFLKTLLTNYSFIGIPYGGSYSLDESTVSGRASLRQLVEALGDGGELIAVEASNEAAKAARGLSIVSGARGCR